MFNSGIVLVDAVCLGGFFTGLGDSVLSVDCAAAVHRAHSVRRLTSKQPKGYGIEGYAWIRWYAGVGVSHLVISKVLDASAGTACRCEFPRLIREPVTAKNLMSLPKRRCLQHVPYPSKKSHAA
jgi:hypothetical protein